MTIKTLAAGLAAWWCVAAAGAQPASRPAAEDAGLLTGYSGERPPKLDDRANRPPELQADIEATVLPRVRLTPPLNLPEKYRLDLAGTWQFARDGEIPPGFSGEFGAIDAWRPMTVPGHFALQGEAKMNAGLKDWSGKVAWARAFDVPAEWRGRRIVLRFEGIDGAARYWLNGEPVGEVSSAFLPVELDVTDAVRFGGGNQLVLTLEKDLLTSWVNRPLGGIGRDVGLMALPPVNLARFHTSVDLDGEYDDATLTALVSVANQGDEPAEDAELRLKLVDPAGREVPLADAVMSLPPIAAGEVADVALSVAVDSPKLWHPETPAVYEATLTLAGVGEEQTGRRPVGFVEVETHTGVLRVNGRALPIKGTNYHTTYPGHAHEPPADVLRADVERLVDANHNAIRPWPTPDAPYMDAADELGIFTTIEVPILAMIYGTGKDGGKGADLAMTRPYLELTARVIETYRSHPSVLAWGLANESPYYEYFERAAFGAAEADPRRPVFFGSDQRIGIGQPGLTLNDDHYPIGGQVTPDDEDIVGGAWEEMPTDLPTMFTEWAHVPWNNGTERQFDPGIAEYFGHYALAHVNETLRHPHIAGGFVFASTPLRGIDRDFDFGYWTERRRPDAILHSVRKAYEPVRLESAEIKGNRAVFRVTNLHAFTDLADLEVRYEQGDAAGEVDVSLAPGAAGGFEVPYDAGAGGPVTVTWADARGVTVATQQARGEPAPLLADTADAGPLRMREAGDALTIENKRFSWTFDQKTGGLTAARVGGTDVVTAGPTLVVHNSGLVAWPNNNAPIEQQLTGWSLDSFAAKQRGAAVEVVVEGAFDQAAGSYTITLRPDGRTEVACDFGWTADEEVDAFEVGVAMDVPERLDTLAWQRDPAAALWSEYPADHLARLRGSAPRLGDPATLDARLSWRRNDERPWSHAQDLVELPAGERASVDFRSTKFGVAGAILHDAGGVGLAVLGGGDTNAHAYPIGGGTIRLLAGTFHNGGTEFHLVKSVRRDVFKIGPGTRVTAAATFAPAALAE